MITTDIDTPNANEPFGTLIGFAPGGVAIYSSDYSTVDKNEYPDHASFRNFLGHEYIGHKWQCVEFARRFLYLNYGVVFMDVGHAYQIFSLRFLRRVLNDAILPLQAFPNGSKKSPEAGALLIWNDLGEFEHTGHVAIITEVLKDKIRIAEQNVIHTHLPVGQQWTRELPMEVTENGYLIHDTFDDTEILGWMIQTADMQYSLPQPMASPELLKIQARHLENHAQFDTEWLNKNDPVQQAYIQANGHKINSTDPYLYFTISQSAKQELVRATNELHLMYLHATDQVLKNDSLLKKFNIPEVLWPRLRLSWSNRRYQIISGRFDFCMDERGLKVYEYNADSASCHTEAGLILQQWAKQGGVTEGFDPARYLLTSLSDAWKHSNAKPFIHLMQDHDKEESYHALFMQKAITEAGFGSKILHGFSDLHWDKRGRLVDDQGQRVSCVWKTWAWETVLEQLRKESEEQPIAPPIRTGHPENEVRLIDVLLRPEIMVFEPLWTAIPSNKAILPVLWDLFPNHRYLLRASFELDDDFIQNGYAAKPIAGRRGDNIALVGQDEKTLHQTAGKFAEQENIYQQLWCLPKIDGLNIQISTFTAGGHFGGACLRSDQSLIIKGESDMQALRVKDDNTSIQ